MHIQAKIVNIFESNFSQNVLLGDFIPCLLLKCVAACLYISCILTFGFCVFEFRLRL